MRVFIILATIALSHGAKLERTYLPPSHARTSGGSGNILETPISGPSRTQPGFSQGAPGQNAPAFSQNAPRFSQNAPRFSQNAHGFSQHASGFSQNAPGFSQSAPEFSQSGVETNAFAKEEYNVNNFGGFEPRPERAQAALERNANILRQDNSNDGEVFSYAYETENGIYAEENGVATNGVEAQGGYSYTGDDGRVYSVRYTADQNGFVPQGDHLPTPPPVPEEILKALEQNARDEAAGIYDDGSYNDGKYDNANGENKYEQNYSGFNSQQNNFNNQQNGFNNDDDTVVTNAAFSRSGNYPSETPASGISAPIYGTPRITSAISTPTFGLSNGPVFGTSDPSFGLSNGAVSGVPSPTLGAPARSNSRTSVPSFGVTSAFSRGTSGSGVDKAYLPPFATQGANGFGRRQQTFDSRNGYRY